MTMSNKPDLKEHYIVDAEGNRRQVVLDINDFRKLLEQLEELASLRAYDTAKASGDDVVAFDQAVDEIERDRE